jgi:hypothetical protein
MTEIEIYGKCLQLGMTTAGAAGCTASILAESAGRSNNVEDRSGINDDVYTAGVDNGTYGNFVNDRYGYGYCQWTLPSRKKALYDYLKGYGKSIADSDGQFQFMAREMRASYTYVWSTLTHTADPYEAGYVMCKFYEIPADTERQAQYRGNQARGIYERCSGTTPVDPDDGKDCPETESFWPPRMICKGMGGADVMVLQALLVARGYTVTAINGVFDDSTDKACRKFQSAAGVAVDGIAGPNTWTAILRR